MLLTRQSVEEAVGQVLVGKPEKAEPKIPQKYVDGFRRSQDGRHIKNVPLIDPGMIISEHPPVADKWCGIEVILLQDMEPVYHKIQRKLVVLKQGTVCIQWCDVNGDHYGSHFMQDPAIHEIYPRSAYRITNTGTEPATIVVFTWPYPCENDTYAYIGPHLSS
jgi:hypothetical protein